ncbi:MAG: hypothetical protein H7Y13_01150 [Sphingobacteriaceae bacterium]|nr:hypothetical protein [Sphingobacteriaceae bacterium]
MSQTLREIIKTILEHVDMNHGIVMFNERFDVSDVNSMIQSRNQFSNLLYSKFYCTGGTITLYNDVLSDIYTPEPEFLSYLSKHNNNLVNKIYGGFFFISSLKPPELKGKGIVRFYFNAIPEGIGPLMNWITFQFEKQMLSYNFKCLASSKSYSLRNDAAVLYIDNKYTQRVYELIKDNITFLSGWLKQGTPLFTKKLFEGIGFGEDTFATEQSFGTYRCDVLTTLIFQASQSGIAKEMWTDYIINGLTHMGFNENTFYLNPGNSGFYTFTDA